MGKKNDPRGAGGVLTGVLITEGGIGEDKGPPWDWFCRVDDRGTDVIDEWSRGNLSPRALARLDRTKDHLSQQPLSRWSRPYASPIGKHIYVIRFEGESRRQWRIFGHAEPGEGRFVMTLPGHENDKVYYPKNAIDLATSYQSVVRSDFERLARACD